jgi:hypothetical protein
VIRDIEKLSAELGVYPLAEPHVLEDRKIKIAIARTNHDIASSVAESERKIVDEGAGVEPLLHSVRTSVWIADQVGSIIAKPGAAETFPRQNRERLSSLKSQNST